MRWLIVLLSLLPVAAQSTGAPTADSEGVMVGAPSSFKIANQGNDGALNLIEMVRPPETLDNWSEMISVITLSDQAVPLDDFYSSWRAGYRAACPGGTENVVNGTVDSNPALKATLSCTRDPKTGKPESVTMVFVQGHINLLAVEMAFRRSMTAADQALVHQIVTSMKICQAGGRTACAARRAFGFLPEG